VYIDALGLARQLHDVVLFAAATVGVISTLWFQDAELLDSSGSSVAEEALSMVPEGDSPTRALLLACLAREKHHVLPLAERWAIADDAVAMARRTGDKRTLGTVLDVWHLAGWAPQNLPERLAASEEMVAIAREVADRRLESWANEVRFVNDLEAADPTGMMDALLQVERLADVIGRGRARWAAHRARCCLHTLRGEFDEARTSAHAALKEAASTDRAREQRQYVAQISVIRFLEGRFDDILDGMPRSLQVRAYHERQVSSFLAATFASADRHLEARQLLDRWLPNVDAVVDWPSHHNTFSELAMFSWASSTLGDRERSEWLYTALYPYRGRCVPGGAGTTTYGPIDLYLALLADVMGDTDAARAHFAAARTVGTRMHARPFLAMADAYEAEMLVRRGTEHAVPEVGDLAIRSLAIAEQLGLGAVQASAEQTLTTFRG
jgi:hypothetical protein